MKYTFQSLAAAVLAAFSFNSVLAVDRIVVLGGLEEGNNYASITSAHAAAVDGDRILIYPNPANYIENLTITKSVQLLSAIEGQYYKLQGSVSIAPSAAGKTIEIHHMDLIAGYSITCAASPAGTRSNFRVFDCKIRSGDLACNVANYYVNFSRDSLFQGQITFRNGRVIGNYISTVGLAAGNNTITCNADVATSDINYIVGNHCVLTANSASPFYTSGIVNSNTTQQLVISGNFIKGNSVYSGGINSSNMKNGVTHLIENNTFHRGTGAAYLGIYMGGTMTANVFNNVIISGTSSYGAIYLATGGNFVNVSYNFTNVTANSSYTNNGTNVINAALATTVDANNGQLLAGCVAIDGGHTDPQYSDLNGTRNDAGCWGGSYSRENFLVHNGNSVTNFVIAPRRILSGTSININAEGYDR